MYRGYDFNAGRDIAWNEINLNESEGENLKKIIEEINIMKQLDHPNIVKYYTGWYDKEKKRVIIITEMVSGGSLKQNLKSIRSPRLRLLKKWIKEILSGLAYLHSKKIIHRDIKCDNIFLDKVTGTLKIGDLGGSVLCEGYATNFVGTEEFMAPEVIEGKYTVKADIYSLGMAIIEMLTMEKPYNELDGAVSIYDHVIRGVYPEAMNKIENQKVLEFIKICLRREKERPSAVELLESDFLKDLDSKENDLPVKVDNMLRQNNFYKPQSEVYKSKASVVSEFSLISPRNRSGNISFNGNTPKIVKAPSKESVLTPHAKQLILSPREGGLRKKKTSSFQITVKDTNHQNCIQPAKMKNEVEINFIIKKEEWKNKSKLVYI